MARIVSIGNRPKNKACHSYSELQDKVLRPTAKGTSSYLADQLYRKLYNNVITLLYNAYQPTSYERTESFLKSITKEKGAIYSGNIYQVKVFFNWKLYEIRKRADGKWSAHEGMSGQEIAKALASILEEGDSKGLFYRDGAAFMEVTMDWFENAVGNLVTSISPIESYVYTGEDTPMDKVQSGIRIRIKK